MTSALLNSAEALVLALGLDGAAEELGAMFPMLVSLHPARPMVAVRARATRPVFRARVCFIWVFSPYQESVWDVR